MSFYGKIVPSYCYCWDQKVMPLSSWKHWWPIPLLINTVIRNWLLLTNHIIFLIWSYLTMSYLPFFLYFSFCACMSLRILHASKLFLPFYVPNLRIYLWLLCAPLCRWNNLMKIFHLNLRMCWAGEIRLKMLHQKLILPFIRFHLKSWKQQFWLVACESLFFLVNYLSGENFLVGD